MAGSCAVCGGPQGQGVLCTPCAGKLSRGDGLIPDHITGDPGGSGDATLVDPYGRVFGLPDDKAVVGRRPTAAVVVLHGTISREHAELSQVDDGWQVRDLGSRNGTWVDGLRVQGRAPLASVSQLRFGEVGFFFFGRRIDAAVPVRSLETAHAVGAASFRFLVSGEAVELLLLGSLATEEAINSGGVVLHRNRGAEDWAEVSLPPLEFHLLRVLCDQAASEAASPSRSRGCVPTKQLAKLLPFQSRYANEENVRQVVRRVRKTLGEIGADAAVEALPGRGYFLAWPVNKE